MNRAAMPDDVVMRGDELLQRRLDVVEIDVGDEAVDGGIDAGRFAPVHIANLRGSVPQAPRGRQGRAPWRRVGIETTDALVVIALRIELFCLVEAFLGENRMFARSARRGIAASSARPSSANTTSPNRGRRACASQQVGGALRRRQPGIERQVIFPGDKPKDRFAVADGCRRHRRCTAIDRAAPSRRRKYARAGTAHRRAGGRRTLSARSRYCRRRQTASDRNESREHRKLHEIGNDNPSA